MVRGSSPRRRHSRKKSGPMLLWMQDDDEKALEMGSFLQQTTAVEARGVAKLKMTCAPRLGRLDDRGDVGVDKVPMKIRSFQQILRMPPPVVSERPKQRKRQPRPRPRPRPIPAPRPKQPKQPRPWPRRPAILPKHLIPRAARPVSRLHRDDTHATQLAGSMLPTPRPPRPRPRQP